MGKTHCRIPSVIFSLLVPIGHLCITVYYKPFWFSLLPSPLLLLLSLLPSSLRSHLITSSRCPKNLTQEKKEKEFCIWSNVMLVSSSIANLLCVTFLACFSSRWPFFPEKLSVAKHAAKRRIKSFVKII